MSLSIPKKKPLNKPVSPVVKLDGKESNVNGGCKPPALATGTRSEGACSSRTGPFAIDICMLSIRSTPAHAFAITANSPSPLLSIVSPLLSLTSHSLVAVNYTRSTIHYQPPRYILISSAGTPRCAL